MKFVVDGMLGKLSRWLRMMGHDVEYSNSLDDANLLAIAKKQRRVLLTRDFELYQRAIAKEIDAFYVQGLTEGERLSELAARFGIELSIDMATSRCPKCNTRVKHVSREKVASQIENNTFQYYDDFWKCPRCGQVYWQGSHWTKIRETLKKASENLKKEQKRESS